MCHDITEYDSNFPRWQCSKIFFLLSLLTYQNSYAWCTTMQQKALTQAVSKIHSFEPELNFTNSLGYIMSSWSELETWIYLSVTGKQQWTVKLSLFKNRKRNNKSYHIRLKNNKLNSIKIKSFWFWHITISLWISSVISQYFQFFVSNICNRNNFLTFRHFLQGQISDSLYLLQSVSLLSAPNSKRK